MLPSGVAMGVDRLVVADGPFPREMRRHPDSTIAAMVVPLDEWARGRNIA
jgi:hypothetical protein